MDRDLVIKNSIFTCITGSHLYGTNIESSDKDFVGIFLPTEEYLLGLRNVEIVDMSTKTEDKKETKDVQYYKNKLDFISRKFLFRKGSGKCK